jgi:arylsulfatase A-like enzyme
VQHVDLVPTICEIAGVVAPPGGDGASLVPLIDGKLHEIRDAVFIEESYVQRKAALRTDRYKYIQALDGTGWCRYCEKVHIGLEELYDLQDDPGETRDLSLSHRALAGEMKGRLNTMIAQLDLKRAQGNGSRRAPDPDLGPTLDAREEQMIKNRLKSLGYLSE